VFGAGVRCFFEEVELVLDGSDDEIVLALLVVLRLLLGGIAGALGSLRPLMDLLVVMLTGWFLLLDHLAALEVPRSNHGLATTTVLTTDDRQFQVVRLVHLGIFRSFADGCSGQSLLVSRLGMRGKERKLNDGTSTR
jgi:hypothetical protein